MQVKYLNYVHFLAFAVAHAGNKALLKKMKKRKDRRGLLLLQREDVSEAMKFYVEYIAKMIGNTALVVVCHRHLLVAAVVSACIPLLHFFPSRY